MNLLSVFLSYSKQKAWLLFDYAEYDLNTILKYYRSKLNTDERVPEEMQKSCLFQTLNGLKYLHENWILHRDLVCDEFPDFCTFVHVYIHYNVG